MIGDSGLYLDGFLIQNLEAENDVLIAKLMANLRYEGSTFDSSVCVSSLHQLVTAKLFDLQIAINDCTLNELIFTLWSADLLSIPIKSQKITTTLLKKLISKDIEKKFGEGQPCEIILSPVGDEAPKFTKHFESYDYSA